MSHIVCKGCGKMIDNLNGELKFCPHCGNVPAKETVCASCGKEIDTMNGSLCFCPYCGEMPDISVIPQNKVEKVQKPKKSKKWIFCGIVLPIITIVLLISSYFIFFAKSDEEKQFEANLEKIQNCEIGDYITFGKYEQDNDSSNGKDDIEWLVLDKQDGKTLVISKYALDFKRYLEEHKSVTWEDSDLREWLNKEFINEAFSEEERKKIQIVTVKAQDNPYYGTDAGDDTQDRIFLLSIQEAEEYFDSDEERKCKATEYVQANNKWTNDDGYCWWWMRSPGDNQGEAAVVRDYGGVDKISTHVSFDGYAVRPALWINVE